MGRLRTRAGKVAFLIALLAAAAVTRASAAAHPVEAAWRRAMAAAETGD